MKKVQMTYEEFKEEHTRLPKLLKKGTKKQREKEANKQSSELEQQKKAITKKFNK